MKNKFGQTQSTHNMLAEAYGRILLGMGRRSTGALLAVVMAGVVAPKGAAAEYTWNVAGDTNGDGVWDATGTNWSPSGADWSAPNPDTAHFFFKNDTVSATVGPQITVNGTVHVRTLKLENYAANGGNIVAPSFTISGGTIDFGTDLGVIDGTALHNETDTPGAGNVTINSVLAGSGGLTLTMGNRDGTGSSALILAGKNTFTGPLTITGQYFGGDGSNVGGVRLASSGTLATDRINVGVSDDGDFDPADVLKTRFTCEGVDQLNHQTNLHVAPISQAQADSPSVLAAGFGVGGHNQTIGGLSGGLFNSLTLSGNVVCNSVDFDVITPLNGVLTLTGEGNAGQPYVYRGAVTDTNFGDSASGGGGTLGIVKDGSGVQVFAGMLTYSGATQVNKGTLVFDFGVGISTLRENQGDPNLYGGRYLPSGQGCSFGDWGEFGYSSHPLGTCNSQIVLGGGTLELQGNGDGSAITSFGARDLVMDHISGAGTLKLNATYSTTAGDLSGGIATVDNDFDRNPITLTSTINLHVGVPKGSINFAGADTTVDAFGVATAGNANFITTASLATHDGYTRFGGHTWSNAFGVISFASVANSQLDGSGTNYIVQWQGTFLDLYNGSSGNNFNTGAINPMVLTQARVDQANIDAGKPVGTPVALKIREARGSYQSIVQIGPVTIDSILMVAGAEDTTTPPVNASSSSTINTTKHGATLNLGGSVLTVGGTNVAGVMVIAAGAADLTVGNGFLQANSQGGLELSNQEATSVLTINAVIQNTANLTTAGNVVLTGTNTYVGTTTIGGGTLTIGGSGTLGSGAYANTIDNSGTLNYASSADQTLSGVMSGAGGIVMNGSGTLTLTAANTHTGDTVVNSGTLALDFKAANIADSTTSILNTKLAINNGATVSMTGDAGQYTQTVLQTSGSGGILKLATDSTTAHSMDANLGEIVVRGSLNFMGATTTLATAPGGTTVAAVGTGGYAVADNANFITANNAGLNDGMTQFGAHFWNSTSWASIANDTTLDGHSSADGGTGTNYIVKWNGAYSDLYTNGINPEGPVQSANWLNPASSLRILDGTADGSGTGAAGQATTAPDQPNGTTAYYDQDGGATSLLMGASQHTALIDFGTHNFAIGNGGIGDTGVVAISAGSKSLTLGVSANDGSKIFVNGEGPGLELINAAAGNLAGETRLTVNAVIANDGTTNASGNKTLITSGVVVLNGDNTYTGTTTVTGGVLFVNGNHAAGTGSYMVGSGATLSGKGAIHTTSGVTLNSGAILHAGIAGADPTVVVTRPDLAPGKVSTISSDNILTINGNLTSAGSTRLVADVDFNSANWIASTYGLQNDGAVADLVHVTGAVDLTGMAFDLTGTQTGIPAAGTHYAIKLFQSDMLVAGYTADVQSNYHGTVLGLASYQSIVTWNGKDFYLVPEPASFALLGLGSLLLLRRPTRRRGRAVAA